MSVNWFSGGRCYDVGYDGDYMRAHIFVNQWQSPEEFEKELNEAIQVALTRMIAKHKELRDSDSEEQTQ